MEPAFKHSLGMYRDAELIALHFETDEVYRTARHLIVDDDDLRFMPRNNGRLMILVPREVLTIIAKLFSSNGVGYTTQDLFDTEKLSALEMSQLRALMHT